MDWINLKYCLLMCLVSGSGVECRVECCVCGSVCGGVVGVAGVAGVCMNRHEWLWCVCVCVCVQFLFFSGFECIVLFGHNKFMFNHGVFLRVFRKNKKNLKQLMRNDFNP